MGKDLPPGAIGVYIHIPFCLARCDYCSFFSVAYRAPFKEAYLKTLQAEIELYLAAEPALAVADTVYFGGGTPSLLSADEIDALCANFRFAPKPEITLEINPLQLTQDYLIALRATPVNRLSLGVQSLLDHELEYLTRRHRSVQIPEKIRLCRDHGFDNISLDLIYGLPGSTLDSVRSNLERMLALEPEHLSCYLLTVEEDSPLWRKTGGAGALGLPDDDTLEAQYRLIRATLVSAGFEHYEISNFAGPGRASRHNLKYWKSDPWLGVGASASGWLPPLRYTNPADLESYARLAREGNLPFEPETCEDGQFKRDYLMMGLRLMEGIDLARYKQRFGTDLYQERKEAIDRLLGLGLLDKSETRLCLSPEAFFISNSVIGELI